MSQPKRALVVIDVQNEYFTGNLKIEYPDVAVSLPNVCRAMDAARAHGIPIVVVQHIAPEGAPIFAPGTPGGALHPEIARRDCDLIVEKKRTSALHGTPLAAWLRERAIDTLTIVGYMTHNCDHTTVLHAGQEGWKVEVLHDATGSVPYANEMGFASAEDIHRVFMIVMQSNFAAVASTEDWLHAVEDGKPLPSSSIVQSNRQAVAARSAG
ncbi:cysteine hydrolase family protein [Propionivibrio soli]|uniref:cysteine hydrolase family protein n=1 Tax=Propionivibrio soli TaxID=2976531 RepID=UPI0021E97892|nr:cysteine hydrolase family protein [Propionivibrio soli]